MPGTHHTALYQTDFIRATKKGSRPRSPPSPPPPSPLPGEKRPGAGGALGGPRALGLRGMSHGGRAGAWVAATKPKGPMLSLPAVAGAGCSPAGVPRVSCPPHSKVTIAELPPRRSPFPYSPSRHGSDRGLSSLLPFPGQRGEAGHADRDKRTEQETRQHRTAALARLKGCLVLPRRSPHPASVTPPPAIRRAPARG